MTPLEEEQAPATDARVRRFWMFFRRYWWLPVLTVLVCMGAAVFYILNTAPTYVSRARMWETVKLRLPESDLFTEDVQTFLGTQGELLQSVTLRNLALQRLQSPGGNRNGIPQQATSATVTPVTIRVAQTSKSSVFLLEASGPDGAYARAYLNALMNAYIEYQKNIRKTISGDTVASIADQVQHAERDLNAEQDALSAFGRTNNLIILQQEAQVSAAYLARLKTQLSDLDLENKLLGATSMQATSTSNNANAQVDWVDPSLVTTSQSADRSSADRLHAVQELEMLKIQRANLSRFLRPQHPKMVKLDADIERGEKFLEVFNRYNRDQLAALRQANAAKIQNVQASIIDWESKVVEENNRIVQSERLKLNVDRAQSAYDRLAKLVENVAIGGNLDQETLAVLEPASSPLRSYNKEARALMIALFGGIILGVGSLLLLMVRDDRIVTCSEINEQMDEAVLTQVPAMKSLNGNGNHTLLQAGDGRHTYAESFRSLRSALMFMEKDGQSPKVVLVTSALPGEGKSTVAMNLGRALALGGSRVALVDADSRKGILHDLLKLRRSPGLTDILHDSGDLKSALQTNSIPNLTLISCGTPSPDGCDLFLGTSFERLLKQLRAQFDYVLIDSSPVFATDDAPSLAPRVDGTIFVVRSRFSTGRAVREALDILYQRNARVLGLVFNHVDPSESSYHYYKYADYFPPHTNGSDTDTAPHAHAGSV